ncbi:MAG TPA: hypothetical protein VLT88_11745, partial [Desulfosarcina sp.]|nr:hypothetical protein [Desulfosarcina sp.]
MRKRIWIPILLAALLASSAPVYAGPALTFTIAVPEGWRKIDTDEPMLFITRDGGYKQFAVAQQRALDKPFQFTQKVLTKGMAPKEAAEIVVNEIMADQNIRDFSLIENVPAQVGDNPAFRLVFVYTDADGFVFKTIYYGFFKGDLFYNIR